MKHGPGGSGAPRNDAANKISSIPLLIDGLPEPVRVRATARNQRLALRVNPAAGFIEVVVPPGSSEQQVRQFVARHIGWVRERLERLPPRLPFRIGAVIPVLGEDHVICHVAGQRGAGTRRDGQIRVGGDPSFVERRVRDLLRREALDQIRHRAEAKSAILGLPIRQIAVRDTRSRWGSCGSNGHLSFSWRLILTPDYVLDYVVAHEVAHLKEMNHSAAFWQLVARLTATPQTAKTWLKTNGAQLLRYG